MHASMHTCNYKMQNVCSFSVIRYNYTYINNHITIITYKFKKADYNIVYKNRTHTHTHTHLSLIHIW